MERTYDVVIVGAGVLGTFHAYHATQQGLRTLLLERTALPRQASVRNFGMIIPSGMPTGRWLRWAMESANLYRELAEQVPFELQQTGTQYLATTEGELAVLKEFGQLGPQHGYNCRLLDAQESVALNQGVHPQTCRGSLHFPDDLRLNPRTLFGAFIPWLISSQELVYLPNTLVTRVQAEDTSCQVTTARGETFHAGHVFVCNGADLLTLFPEHFSGGQVEYCKLQMLRLAPPDTTVSTSLASGLSIRRYDSFRLCPSWTNLEQEAVDPELQRFGIHLLFVQDADGSVVVGDSHQYSSDPPDEFLEAHIEELILGHAKHLVQFPRWQVTQRWAGVYTRRKSEPDVEAEPGTADLYHEVLGDRIHLLTGVAGRGMTTGPALARESLAGMT